MKKISLCVPEIGTEEEEAVVKVLQSKWITHGPKNIEFEELFANYIGVKHAISLNSCTSGLHLSIQANKISGEVIVPSFSWAASANAIVTAGAIPVFADINIEDRNLNPKHVESLITKKTEAIILVHYGGQTAEVNSFIEICKKHNLLLIEDSAENIGGEYLNKKAGSFGIGNFSFFPTKNITVGEGGMITTNDIEFANKIRILINHGMSKSTFERGEKELPWYKNALEAGYNFRMSNILAAIGVEQIKKIDSMNNQRRNKSKYLTKKLHEIDFIKPPTEIKDRKHVYQTYSVIINKNVNRNSLIKHLRDCGIEASVHFDPPIHLQQYYKLNYPKVVLPVTEFVSSHIISLPMYPSLREKDIDYIVSKIKEFKY